MDNRSFLLDGTLGSGPASLHGSPAKRRTLALKEQENVGGHDYLLRGRALEHSCESLARHWTLQTINELKKENFSLKLKIFFLEERMTKMAPENVKDAYKEVGGPTGCAFSFEGSLYNSAPNFVIPSQNL